MFCHLNDKFIWSFSSLFLYIKYCKSFSEKLISVKRFNLIGQYLYNYLLRKLFRRLVLFTREKHVTSESIAGTDPKHTQTSESHWFTENQSALGGLNPNLRSSWQTRGGKHGPVVSFLYLRQTPPSKPILRQLFLDRKNPRRRQEEKRLSVCILWNKRQLSCRTHKRETHLMMHQMSMKLRKVPFYFIQHRSFILLFCKISLPQN